MAAAILVLGPSRWQQPKGHPFLEDSPLEIRRSLARLMQSHGAEALLMEDRTPAEGEDNFGLLTRLVGQEDVRSFVLFWPVGARLHGLAVEIGYLLSLIEHAHLDPRSVYLLAERRLLDVRTGEAILAWSEPGNRTRYHEDLVARGCRIRRWSSQEALRAHTSAVAVEHLLRHG